MIKEYFVDVFGYCGLYIISNLGTVVSLPKQNGFRFSEPKTIKPSVDINNYYRISLRKNNKPKIYMLSRVVFESFGGHIKNGIQINHIDGNRANNAIANLEATTAKQNCWHRDNILNGHSRGEKNNMVKITENDAILIKEMIASKAVTQREIAKMYGLHYETISQISRGILWGHL